MSTNEQTEQEMRECEAPTPDDIGALRDYIDGLVNRGHDYGTCVYAMSLAATAAFNFVARKLGVTGFQASCADTDILRRTRRLKHGFMLLDASKVDTLYDSDTAEAMTAEELGISQERYDEVVQASVKAGQREGHVVIGETGRRVYANY